MPKILSWVSAQEVFYREERVDKNADEIKLTGDLDFNGFCMHS